MNSFDSTLNKYNIKNENRLFLTIKNVYLDEMRQGLKNVEYRNNTEFFRRKLFLKGKDRKPSLNMKPLKYILFQGGYEPDSPRMLIKLKGWTIGAYKYPPNLNCMGHEIITNMICLLLGEIIYDSQDGQLYSNIKNIKSKSHKPKCIKKKKPKDIKNAFAQVSTSKLKFTYVLKKPEEEKL